MAKLKYFALTALLALSAGVAAATGLDPTHQIDIPVLKESLQRGAVIKPEDITLATYDVRRLNQNTLKHEDDVIGMELTRSQRAGALIYSSAVRVPPLVSRNSIVTVKTISGPLELTIRGRAMQDGLAGDLVQIMNTSSNQIVHATVIAPGVVQVN